MGLFSSLFGSGKTTTKSEPWKAQQPYLKEAFGSAQDIYNQQKGTPYYQGALYAGQDPTTKEGLAATKYYATGAGADLASGVSGAAGNLIGTQGNYLSTLDRYSGLAFGDPTEDNIASAERYANSPYLDSQIDAASRDVVRQFQEQDIPGINRAATGSGNINSSRAGVAAGIAQRGAEDRVGDIAAQMRGDAYNQGLSLAEQARGTNLSAAGQSTGLYGQALGQGLSAANQGLDMTYQNLENLVNSGKMTQEDAQKILDEQFQKWQGNDTRDSDLLSRYYSIIGANNWGGTQTATGVDNGILGKIAGIGASAAGTFAKFSGMGA